ncbi:MAG: PD-(D/E)XK nuclease family protein, partial [Desulfonatronovibrio sp.]
GAGIPVYDNALLQILPLVLEMAWTPPDPQRALELLTLPVSPVPRNIAMRLARALHNYPAVGSEAWQEKMNEGLQSIEDANRRSRIQARVEAVFKSRISKGDYSASEIISRIDLIRDWARGRMEYGNEDLNWQPLIAQLENARRLIDISGLQSFTAPQIKRMIYDLNQESSQLPLFPDQAGLAHVSSPECLAGSAKHVIWWSFNQDSVQSVYIDPFSQAEKKALKNAGVTLPDPGKLAEHYARRWQRPLMLAENTLVLVCPESSSAGEEQFPHPLWDELAGRMKDDNQASGLQSREINDRVKPVKTVRQSLDLPEPIPLWKIDKPGLILKLSNESANSLSSLLSCPLQWVINYQGRISSGLSAALSEPEELEGWFVHEIVSRFLEKFRHDTDISIDELEQMFDEQGPRLAARLFLPGFDHLRARVRNTTRDAVEQVLQVIDQGGFKIQHVEDSLEQFVTKLDCTLYGTPDLVLDSPLAVVDFKRGGKNFRQKELQNGASVQLAVYSRLLYQDGDSSMPPAAYFLLLAGQLITAYPDNFPDSMPVNGPALEDTWEAVIDGYNAVWKELEKGEIRATGNEDEPPGESALIDGRLQLVPCAFCGLDNLCGKAFGEN